MRVAILQLNAQGLSSTKLYKYIRIASTQNVKVLLLGEYILNPFFNELKNMSMSMIKAQTSQQIEILKELSSTYNLTLVAPLVIVKKNKIYKCIGKFSPSSTSYYQQQILINYPHWNEEKYFDNEIKAIQSPMIFFINGFKFAVFNGFELHFDAIFDTLKGKNIDCILLPSVSTFESYSRWEALITSRSFTHNCYILRANRIGEYQDKDLTWKFYGDSLLTSPDGEVLEHLTNNEELMIADLNHADVIRSRKFWGFKDTINKRSKLL